MGHAQRNPNATCALECASPHAGNSSITWAQGCAQHWGKSLNVYAWYTQHTGKQPKRPRLGRPSVRWLQLGMQLASVACPTPKPGYQASGVRSTLVAPQPGAWVLQATASPPVQNSAIHNEFTHSKQYFVL